MKMLTSGVILVLMFVSAECAVNPFRDEVNLDTYRRIRRGAGKGGRGHRNSGSKSHSHSSSSEEICPTLPCDNGLRMTHCHCDPGYEGSACEHDINDCSADPCFNGGTCSDGINSFSCACAAGFSGDQCQEDINDCLPTDPCNNGGSCHNHVGAGYHCDCAAGWMGVHCDDDVIDCVANTCHNGGTCVEKTDDFDCQCAAGWTGERCEIRELGKLDDVCQDTGDCTTENTECRDAKCQCVLGYSFDASKGACVTACDQYGDTFYGVLSRAITGNNNENFAATLAECKQRCIDATSYTCVSFDYGQGMCYLTEKSALDNVNVRVDNNYDLYHRHCATTAP